MQTPTTTTKYPMPGETTPSTRYHKDGKAEALAAIARRLKRLLEAGAIMEEERVDVRRLIERAERELDPDKDIVR